MKIKHSAHPHLTSFGSNVTDPFDFNFILSVHTNKYSIYRNYELNQSKLYKNLINIGSILLNYSLYIQKILDIINITMTICCLLLCDSRIFSSILVLNKIFYYFVQPLY